MKNLLLILATLVGLNGHAQVIADPTIEQVSFTDISGNAINDTMPIGYIAQLNIPIRNLDIVNGVPGGSCKIKIGLGTKLVLDPSFNIALASTGDYFDWSASFIGGQVQITGELRDPLPANYSGIAKFNVMGSILDYSTITTNFLVTNHNSQVILSDENPSNNSSFRQYKIIAPITTPVNFANIIASNDNCSINISFTAENEINVSRFDFEYSKDGIVFAKFGTLNASRQINYSFKSPISADMAGDLIYLRIKSIDKNGTYKYSSIKTVNGLCNLGAAFILYPNPVKNEGYVTVKVSSGTLGKSYQAALFDMAGKVLSTKEIEFSGQQQFTYPIMNIAAGQYLLKLFDKAGTIKEIVVIQKH